MIIVMQAGAPEEQLQEVLRRVEDMKLKDACPLEEKL